MKYKLFVLLSGLSHITKGELFIYNILNKKLIIYLKIKASALTLVMQKLYLKNPGNLVLLAEVL